MLNWTQINADERSFFRQDQHDIQDVYYYENMKAGIRKQERGNRKKKSGARDQNPGSRTLTLGPVYLVLTLGILAHFSSI